MNETSNMKTKDKTFIAMSDGNFSINGNKIEKNVTFIYNSKEIDSDADLSAARLKLRGNGMDRENFSNKTKYDQIESDRANKEPGNTKENSVDCVMSIEEDSALTLRDKILQLRGGVGRRRRSQPKKILEG